jgi:GNAT superfamily N-acetyltransferase
MPAHEIHREEQDAASVAHDLASRLRTFNEERAGPLDSKPLVLSIRNENGDVVAGLSGWFFWNTLFVDILWVDEVHRGRACGSALLEHAEREASEHGYDFVYLSSFGFQAPQFYLKLGYTLIGELDGTPRGSRRQWLAKHVSRSAVNANRSNTGERVDTTGDAP